MKFCKNINSSLTHTVSQPGMQHFMAFSRSWISRSVISVPQIQELKSRIIAALFCARLPMTVL